MTYINTFKERQILNNVYKIKIESNDTYYIDLPLEVGRDTSLYRASLGHKVNHSFRPNCCYRRMQHPRWGEIVGIFSSRDIKAALSKKYKVSGIPSLVLLDGDGAIITKDGRQAPLVPTHRRYTVHHRYTLHQIYSIGKMFTLADPKFSKKQHRTSLYTKLLLGESWNIHNV